MRVPFAGFKGDYQSIQVDRCRRRTASPGWPSGAAPCFVNQPAGATYTLQGDDVPFFLVHFDHQARRLVMEIRDAATGQPVHPVFHDAFEDDYLPRNAAPRRLLRLRLGRHPPAQQRQPAARPRRCRTASTSIVVKALKALGDPNNPAHWETWTSPVVTLDRP